VRQRRPVTPGTRFQVRTIQTRNPSNTKIWELYPRVYPQIPRVSPFLV